MLHFKNSFLLKLLSSFLVLTSLQASSAWTEEEMKRLRVRQAREERGGKKEEQELKIEQTSSLLELPDEILTHIAGYLDLQSLEHLRATCRRFWGIANTVEAERCFTHYTAKKYRETVKKSLPTFFRPSIVKSIQLSLSTQDPALYEGALKRLHSPEAKKNLSEDFLRLLRENVKNPATLLLFMAYPDYFFGAGKRPSFYYYNSLPYFSCVPPETLAKGIQGLEAGDCDIFLEGAEPYYHHVIKRAFMRLTREQVRLARDNWDVFFAEVEEDRKWSFTKGILDFFYEDHLTPNEKKIFMDDIRKNKESLFIEGMSNFTWGILIKHFASVRFFSAEIQAFLEKINNKRGQLFEGEDPFSTVRLMTALTLLSSVEISAIAETRSVFFRNIVKLENKISILKAIQDENLTSGQIIEFAAALGRNSARLFPEGMREDVQVLITVEMAKHTGTQIDFIAKYSSGYFINFLGVGALGVTARFTFIK